MYVCIYSSTGREESILTPIYGPSISGLITLNYWLFSWLVTICLFNKEYVQYKLSYFFPSYPDNPKWIISQEKNHSLEVQYWRKLKAVCIRWWGIFTVASCWSDGIIPIQRVCLTFVGLGRPRCGIPRMSRPSIETATMEGSGDTLGRREGTVLRAGDGRHNTTKKI